MIIYEEKEGVPISKLSQTKKKREKLAKEEKYGVRNT